jgi:fluoroquinolone transport system ATP-binding protein
MIQVDNLSYCYPGNRDNTIKGLSFSIRAGEVFGFLGPSGAGKSTTQAILTRQIETGFSGELSILGKSISEWDRELFRHIGVSFELPNHYEKLSALENLQFFAAFYGDCDPDFDALLEQVNLLQARDLRVAQFSKGMKMRLNFVRAMMHDPDILFLDEPTSGLDPTNAKMIKDHIRRFKAAGKTVFLTTHNMHDADELCDQVAFLVDGQIKLIDAPKELKLQYGQRQLEVGYRQDGVMNTQHFAMQGLGHNQAFVDFLGQHEVETMHSQEASLEQIFVQCTGRTLQ